MIDLAILPLPGAHVVLRQACIEDVAAIVALLAADQLGAARDAAISVQDLSPYIQAFRVIDADPRTFWWRHSEPRRPWSGICFFGQAECVFERG